MTIIKEYEAFTPEQLASFYPGFDHIAEVRCPSCKSIIGISKKIHTITEHGEMRPSLICPHCRFHDYVALENYPHNSIPEITKQVLS